MESSHVRRPTTNRSVTAPTIYQRRAGQDEPQPQMRLQSLAPLSGIPETVEYVTGPLTTDSYRRTLGPSEVRTTTSDRPTPLPTPSPTPGPMSRFSSTQSPFSPGVGPPTGSNSASIPSMRSPYSNESSQPSYFPMMSHSAQNSHSPLNSAAWGTSMAPSISASRSSSNTPSPLIRQSSQAILNVQMDIISDKTSHTLLAPIGTGFTVDGITIAQKKNNVLGIVADRWDQEKDCHIEWEVTLDKDADMSSISASFNNGLLQVKVKRRLIDKVTAPMLGGSAYRIGNP